MAPRVRKLTAFTVVVVSLGLVASYEIDHHTEGGVKVVECPGNATLAGGLPLPAGVPCPSPTTAVEPTASEPATTYPPAPPASKAVPFSEGYSSQGWAVAPGSLDMVDGLVYAATVRVRNGRSRTRPASFDVYVYTKSTLVADLQPPTGNTVKPGATDRLYLYYIYGDDNLNVERLAQLPNLTYLLVPR
jgi:hypothetical protein